MAILVLTLECSITGGMPGRAHIHIGVPPPPNPSEAERRVRVQERLERRREDWNTLCLLAGHGRFAPGYQETRWSEIRFRDAEEERWYKQQLTYRHVETRIIRPAEEAVSPGNGAGRSLPARREPPGRSPRRRHRSLRACPPPSPPGG